MTRVVFDPSRYHVSSVIACRFVLITLLQTGCGYSIGLDAEASERERTKTLARQDGTGTRDRCERYPKNRF